jgi:putative salt-induced outer membrane protein YdiY
MTNGTRETGLIQKSAELDTVTKGFIVQSKDLISRSRTAEVVTMAPVEKSMWDQLGGSIDYGFTYTGGTSATQSTLSGDVAYRGESWRAKLDGSSVVNRQKGAEESGRNTVNFYYFKYRGDRWFVAGTAGFLNSKQQDLTARTTFGGGIGWDLVRSSTTNLQFVSGVLFNNEKYSPESGSRSGRGADSQFLIQFSKYSFTKFQFTSQIGVFPSLSTLGRVRMNAESSLKREIVRNFNIKFSVYESYDSQPPVNAPKNDFGTTTSFGWTF